MPHFPRSADTRIANSRAPQSIPNRHPPSLHAFSSFRSRCGSKEEDLSHSKVRTSPCRGRNQGFEHGTTGLKVLRWDGSMIHAFGRVIRMGSSQLRGFGSFRSAMTEARELDLSTVTLGPQLFHSMAFLVRTEAKVARRTRRDISNLEEDCKPLPFQNSKAVASRMGQESILWKGIILATWTLLTRSAT